MSGWRFKRLPPFWKGVLWLILAGALVFGALLGLVLGGARDDVSGDPKTMVVLGCQLYDWGPSIMLRDRLDKALDYLADHGFPRENIILEDRSVNTFQNLSYTARLLGESGIDVEEGVVVVSNGFHLTRAKMLAGRVGFENVSVLAAPSSHTPTRLKMYVREPLALVKSFLFDR